MSNKQLTVLVNGISAGTGGGLSVARQLSHWIGEVRPNWKVILTAIEGHPLHHELIDVGLPENVDLQFLDRRLRSKLYRRIFEKQRLIDVIEACSVSSMINLNGMAFDRFPIPLIAHFQDPFPYRPEAWTKWSNRFMAMAKRRAHAHSLKHADACGFTSHYLQNLICKYHQLTPPRCEVFYNGVSRSWLERDDRNTRPLTARGPVLATVGNVFPYKRQELVVRAVAQLRQCDRLSEVKYFILGAIQNDYRVHLETQIEKLDLQNHVFIEGRVSQDRIEETLGDAAVMPLMSVCESFGIPLIEAMTFGTPVVVADCCALPEVAGNAAIVCPVDDLQALVASLRSVLTEPDLASQLRTNGFQRAKLFNWERTANKMAETIETIVGATNSAT